jgi:hypothetical protein
MEKLLNKVAVINAHPDIMSGEQVGVWFEVLRGMKDVRVDDISGATPIRCVQGCTQSKFSVYVAGIARIDVVLTRIHPESKKYSVSSMTEYYNVGKSYHGAKKPNTWQRELLRQQEFFQEQQRASVEHAIAMHQQHVNDHMQHVHQHHVMMHHHHNF